MHIDKREYGGQETLLSMTQLCLFGDWRGPSKLSWLVSKPQQSTCLWLSTAGITSLYHHIWLFFFYAIKFSFDALKATIFPNGIAPSPKMCLEFFFRQLPETTHLVRKQLSSLLNQGLKFHISGARSWVSSKSPCCSYRGPEYSSHHPHVCNGSSRRCDAFCLR